MGLPITDEHTELAAVVRRWVEKRETRKVARALADAAARGPEGVDRLWQEEVDQGWVGLAMSEASGGSGYGLAELGVVLEELGRGCAPGPLLTTAAVAVVLDRAGVAPEVVAALAAGEASAAVALPAEPTLAWGGADSAWFLVPVEGEADDWAVVEAATAAPEPVAGFDATRPLARVAAVGPELAARSTAVIDEGILGLDPADLVGLLASAEALGVAQWCVDTAATYACDRVQFGRPIGQFQAVKHRIADMLVALEAARAAVWDALRAVDGDEPGTELAVAAALALAPEAAFRCAEDCIQVLGGIGYTWEHDAHLFLKRATAVRHLLPAPAEQRARVADAVVAGVERPLAIDLPPEAEPARDRVRAFAAEVHAQDKSEWRRLLVESGYLVPHWPPPWGLDASPVEQLAIDAELKAAHIRRPHLQVAGWVLPTLIAHGTPEQQDRWIGPSLLGEITWCQLFSEPGAGSDLASLTTRAVRVEGGWSITGQKVWTTLAHQAQWGICLARTDPDAPKHEGIGCFFLDMTTPGIDIRPLRELTGMALFNEVFLTDVFVPDDCVIGAPTAGWASARTTLANERVSMASGSSFGPGVASLFELAGRTGAIDDPRWLDDLGALVIDAHCVALLGLRTTLRALGGAQPGPEASVRKLLGVTHEQQVQEAGLALLGPDAAVAAGEGQIWSSGFLGNRALSIAGGTSEIQRNVIAERLLGLPKDP